MHVRPAPGGASLAAALLLSGCGSDHGVNVTHAHPGTLEQGGFSVVFDANAPSIELRRGKSVLLSFPADGIELGKVDSVDDQTNYDPWGLVGSSGPAGLRWLSVTTAALETHSDSSFTVALTFDEDARAELVVELKDTGRFQARLEPAAGSPGIAYFRLSPRVDASEAFYGLGEYYDDVNSRGKVRAMQHELDFAYESSDNEAHVPIPFVIGTRGWGLFVENPYPAIFDVAAAADDRVTATFGTGTSSGDGLVFHLFGADRPLDVTRHYYEITGYPHVPAPWALGPWIWRDENVDQAQVESDAATIRDLDLATTAIWIDRPYATGVNTFDFEAARFPDPPAMIQALHTLGFRTALWHTPYLDGSDPATQPLRDVAQASGFWPPVNGLLLNRWGPPIDLTNPDAFSWWQGLIHKYTDLGVEGFKLDYGEDIAPGLPGTRNVWQFFDGSDERTMHAFFQRFYHRVYGETLPDDGGFLLCRSSTYGDQKNVGVIWPGDLDASFARRGDSGGTTKLVGGLPASLIAGLTLGPSGFPFYASDTGGYRHSPPNKETFMRWFEQTSFWPVMEIGTSTNDVAWEFTAANGFDQQSLDAYRVYVRWKLRLFPYLWTYAQNLARDGRAIARALGFAYPELGVHPSDEYLLGDSLLVAPVVDAGLLQRDVTFPPGKWLDFWSGDVVDGGASGTTQTVDAPLDRLPVFVAAGGIVPLLRPTIDTLSPTTDPARVDSYATDHGVLWVRLAPGPKSAFTVFDGTTITQQDDGTTISVTVNQGSDFVAGLRLEVIGLGAAPRSVTENGQPVGGMSWDPATGGTLFVDLAPGAHALSIER